MGQWRSKWPEFSVAILYITHQCGERHYEGHLLWTKSYESILPWAMLQANTRTRGVNLQGTLTFHVAGEGQKKKDKSFPLIVLEKIKKRKNLCSNFHILWSSLDGGSKLFSKWTSKSVNSPTSWPLIFLLKPNHRLKGKKNDLHIT